MLCDLSGLKLTMGTLKLKQLIGQIFVEVEDKIKQFIYYNYIFLKLLLNIHCCILDTHHTFAPKFILAYTL